MTHLVALAPPSPPFPPLTIVTSMFLHGGWLHIGFNMLFLFVFGPAIEYVCGHVRFLAYYLLCGIAGGIAQIVIGPGSHVPALGASGAIAGVLGGYLVTFPFASIRTIVPIVIIPLFVRLPAILVIGVWAATQFLNGFATISDRAAESTGGTAYFAHIGGFCAGVLLIGLMSRKRVRGQHMVMDRAQQHRALPELSLRGRTGGPHAKRGGRAAWGGAPSK